MFDAISHVSAGASAWHAREIKTFWLRKSKRGRNQNRAGIKRWAVRAAATKSESLGFTFSKIRCFC
jgi:hypothetical protein